MHRGLAAVVVVLLALPVILTGAATAQDAAPSQALILRPPVVVRAAAVAQTDNGLIGSIATVSISVAEGGRGHVFMDTIPLTEVDMQGSARLATKVASQVTGISLASRDFFFVVRSNSQIIGGPSAGGILALGAVAALKGWELSQDVLMTGTINPDGSIGPVGGVPEKAQAAANVGANVFLYPEGQDQTTRVMGEGLQIVNMTDYCKEVIRIVCIPVGTIEEAVLHATGFEFAARPSSTGNLSTARYEDVLRPSTRTLIDRARGTYTIANASVAGATTLAPEMRAFLTDRLVAVRNSLNLSEEAHANRSYYTTASRAFQAAIDGRFTRLALEYFTDPEPAKVLASRVEEAGRVIAEAAARTSSAPLVTTSDLEARAAAESRVTDAETALAEAKESTSSGSPSDTLSGLNRLAYAFERAATVTWWLDTVTALGQSTLPIDQDAITARARETVETSRESVTYSGIVLAEMGVTSPEFARAEAVLADAQKDLARGFYAGALFEAFEAEVRANLALELAGYRGAFPESKIARARVLAEDAIRETRAAGVDPFLAVSYFEFASALTDSLPTESMTFYRLARISARLVVAPDGESAPRDSRFVGAPIVVQPFVRVPPSTLSAYFSIGIGLGALAALAIVLMPTRRVKPAPDDAAPLARDDEVRTPVATSETSYREAWAEWRTEDDGWSSTEPARDTDDER